jgi:hypothetical protein
MCETPLGTSKVGGVPGERGFQLPLRHRHSLRGRGGSVGFTAPVALGPTRSKPWTPPARAGRPQEIFSAVRPLRSMRGSTGTSGQPGHTSVGKRMACGRY